MTAARKMTQTCAVWAWTACLGPTSLFHLPGGGILCPPSAHPQPTPGLGSLFPSTWPLTVWTVPIEQIVQIKTKQETNEQFQEEREEGNMYFKKT